MWTKFQNRLWPIANKSKPGELGKDMRQSVTELSDSPRLVFGSTEKQGLRQSMEDRSLIVADLDVSGLGKIFSPQALVAVMDGHGGAAVSDWLHKNLSKEIRIQLTKVSIEITRAKSQLIRDMIISHAIETAFSVLDQRLLTEAKVTSCGSCLTGALVIGPRLYVFNIGDSRTLLCRSGQLQMETKDHRPDNPSEWDRICEAGGLVLHGRVMGELAVSRAFGDFHLKDPSKLPTSPKQRQSYLSNSSQDAYPTSMIARLQTIEDISKADISQSESIEDHGWDSPLVISTPDITVVALTDQDEFLLLACDGLFDVTSNEEAVGIVHNKLHAKVPLSRGHRFKLNSSQVSNVRDPKNLADQACEDLANSALIHGSQDNISVMLVLIQPQHRIKQHHFSRPKIGNSSSSRELETPKPSQERKLYTQRSSSFTGDITRPK